MKRLSNLIKALLTNGRDNQAFIGAKWLVALLRLTPSFLRRGLALRIVSISPHYFYRSSRPEYTGMPTRQFLECEYERNRTSRERIVNQLLVPHLKPEFIALDIGCGPGFLARAVSRHVKKLYACDISRGVLECARTINGAPNITYIYSGDTGFAQVPDAGVDFIYSFAVIQHVREMVIKSLFEMAGKKVCPGGKCLIQVQLEDGKWARETALDADQSVSNQIRMKYGLNFFPRSESFFKELATATGFTLVKIQPVRELLDEPFDDVYHQHLITLIKNPA